MKTFFLQLKKKAQELFFFYLYRTSDKTGRQASPHPPNRIDFPQKGNRGKEKERKQNQVNPVPINMCLSQNKATVPRLHPHRLEPPSTPQSPNISAAPGSLEMYTVSWRLVKPLKRVAEH